MCEINITITSEVKKCLNILRFLRKNPFQIGQEKKIKHNIHLTF